MIFKFIKFPEVRYVH